MSCGCSACNIIAINTVFWYIAIILRRYTSQILECLWMLSLNIRRAWDDWSWDASAAWKELSTKKHEYLLLFEKAAIVLDMPWSMESIFNATALAYITLEKGFSLHIIYHLLFKAQQDRSIVLQEKPRLQVQQGRSLLFRRHVQRRTRCRKSLLLRILLGLCHLCRLHFCRTLQGWVHSRPPHYNRWIWIVKDIIFTDLGLMWFSHRIVDISSIILQCSTWTPCLAQLLFYIFLICKLAGSQGYWSKMSLYRLSQNLNHAPPEAGDFATIFLYMDYT